MNFVILYGYIPSGDSKVFHFPPCLWGDTLHTLPQFFDLTLHVGIVLVVINGECYFNLFHFVSVLGVNSLISTTSVSPDGQVNTKDTSPHS